MAYGCQQLESLQPDMDGIYHRGIIDNLANYKPHYGAQTGPINIIECAHSYHHLEMSWDHSSTWDSLDMPEDLEQVKLPVGQVNLG